MKKIKTILQVLIMFGFMGLQLIFNKKKKGGKFKPANCEDDVWDTTHIHSGKSF